jgi:hypothetical protein
MKTLSIFFIALFCAITAFAQAPQSFSYQAIANNASGAPVVNGSVKVRISILDNTATGAVLYTETHAKTTNAQGLFNLNIGQGTVAAGTFSGINWGVNPKFVKVELDPAGGTNYTTVGTSQFQSVPYSMYAEKVNPANVTSVTSASSTPSEQVIAFFTSGNYVYGFADSTGWSIAGSFGGTVVDTFKSKDCIGFRTSSNYLYSFSKKRGWEIAGSFGGTITATYQTNGCVVLVTSNNYLYGLSSQRGWEIAGSFGGTIADVRVLDNCIVIRTSNNYFYGFSRKKGWDIAGSFSGTINTVYKN